MSIETLHPLYIENLPLWQKADDCISGQDAVKKASTAYLPRPGGQSDAQYKAYLERASFTMFTARCLEGLYGQIFSKAPEKSGDIPELFQNLLDNVDLAGSSIDQFASDLLYPTLAKPWTGILVDHPPVQEGMNQADKEKLGLDAYLKAYLAYDIINWRYDVIYGMQKLTLVVLKENYNTISEKDKFVPILKTRYRVLELVDGIYTQEVWEQFDNTQKQKEWIITEQYKPMLNGKYLDFIPFFLCPAKEPEKSMLLPIMYLNITHYQRCADYNNLLHFTGTPTGYFVGVKPPMKEVKDSNNIIRSVPDEIKLGGDAALFLEGSGTESPRAGYLEPSGAGAGSLVKSLEDIKLDIEKMGGDLIAAKKKGVETAEAAKIHQAGENAVLGSFSLNMSEKITQAVRLCAKWRGVPDEIADNFYYSLNMDYEGDLSNSDKINQGIRLYESDLLSKQTFLTDFMDYTEEEAEEEAKLIDGAGIEGTE